MESVNITSLSHELLCHIIRFLPLRETLAVAMLCKKLFHAVQMYLRLCKSIDFSRGEIFGYMPVALTDDHIHSLLKKCPKLEIVYGLNPVKVERRRLRKRSALTVPGIIEALCLCPHLKKVETSDLRLLEGILLHLPQLEITGNVRNRDGVFPPQVGQRLKLQPYPRITCLHLIGVEVPELTVMPELQHLHLQWVRFTRLHPFRAFMATNLRTFVMKHCMGPAVPMRYLSLFIALSTAANLTRLELVRVPLPGGLIQRAVEDTWKNNGFRKLRTLVIGACKGILESDLGHLMIVSSPSLQSLSIQPSLTRDSLFVSLFYAHCDFSNLNTLHLGYVDDFPKKDEWSNDYLLTLGLADVPEVPSSLTDSGMKVVSQLFPNVSRMSVCNCPHLMTPDKWITEGEQVWNRLTYLTLQKCHCLRLTSFALFLALLNNIETLILVDMFREPPKGCSHVGLSAGTGLGMSSAVVSNQDEHIAVQGHQQDILEQPIDEQENGVEGNELQLDDVEEIQYMRVEQQQRLLVLPEQLFDEREETYNMINVSGAECSKSKDSNNNDKNKDDEEIKSDSEDYCSVPSTSSVVSLTNTSRSTIEFDSNDASNSDRAKGHDLKKTIGANNLAVNNVKAAKHKSYPSNKEVVENNAYLSSDKKSSQCKGSSCRKDDDHLSQPSTSKSEENRVKLDMISNEPTTSSSKSENVLYVGPLTRRRKRMLSCNGSCDKDFVSQATQATSEDIRSSLAREKTLPNVQNCKDSKYHIRKKTASCSRKGNELERQGLRKKTVLNKRDQHHKSTSTSDPLLEDDAIQTFRVVSESLMSLTVVNCGISDIIIDHCHRLMHIEVQACRILRKCTLHHCPSLIRIGVTQCPKLDMSYLASELIHLERKNSTIIYVEPCVKDYREQDIERSILCSIPLSKNFILVHDYGSENDDRGLYRQNLIAWLKLFSLLTTYMLSKQSVSSSLTKLKISETYPWGHHLYRLHGCLPDGKYEMLTNNPLLSASWHGSDSHTLGLHDPQSYGFSSVSDLIEFLDFDIADWVEIGRGTDDKFLAFYIHVAETNLTVKY